MTTMEQRTTMKAKITAPGDREVRIERIFNAPRDRVWRAMTDPKLIDGMLQSGMESGVNESYAALDRVIAAMG